MIASNYDFIIKSLELIEVLSILNNCRERIYFWYLEIVAE